LPLHVSKNAAKKNIVRAIDSVATRLGNTTSVCRKCYIHPAIVDAYLEGEAIKPSQSRLAGRHRLSPQEEAVVALIARWSKRRAQSTAA
jgi:DNA topoisomerase-1